MFLLCFTYLYFFYFKLFFFFYLYTFFFLQLSRHLRSVRESVGAIGSRLHGSHTGPTLSIVPEAQRKFQRLYASLYHPRRTTQHTAPSPRIGKKKKSAQNEQKLHLKIRDKHTGKNVIPPSPLPPTACWKERRQTSLPSPLC